MLPIRFSIIITCHNQRDFIRAAVDSALSQSHPLKEVIVVDDGSQDGSVELLEYADSIRLIRLRNNRGAIEARNQGARQANGEYLVFLDGDDALRQRALSIYDRLIVERNPKIIMG